MFTLNPGGCASVDISRLLADRPSFELILFSAHPMSCFDWGLDMLKFRSIDTYPTYDMLLVPFATLMFFWYYE